MAKVLITGAAGFIGSSLTHAFTANGHDVIGLDNLHSGTMANLRDVVGKFSFIEGDIRDIAMMQKACSGVEIILHQAAIASTTMSVTHPLLTDDVNVTGTLNLLSAAHASGVRRVIFASSAAVYGDQEECPQHEELRPLPLSPYGVQKLACERHLRSFCEQYGMEAVSLRYFNVFGPRQSTSSTESGVVVHFISKLLAGQRPTIHGDGGSSRDFTFIADVVQANELACLLPGPIADGRAYNIGTGRGTAVIELYRTLTRILGLSTEPQFGLSRTADVRDSCAAIQKAQGELKYRAVTELDSCLRQTIMRLRIDLEQRIQR